MTMLDRMRRHRNWLKWSLAIVCVSFVLLYIPSFLGDSRQGAAGCGRVCMRMENFIPRWRMGVLPMRKSVSFSSLSRILAVLLPLLMLCTTMMPALAAGAADAPSKRAANLTRMDGYVPFYFDGSRGRVLMEIPVFDQDVLYYVSAATNPGSGPR